MKKHRAGFAAILGRPNAGKSTLLNALLGQKVAIVASRPQTTRTSIQGVLTLAGAQIVFVDTPGIHKSSTLLNKRMMDTVRSSTDSDVVLFLIDALIPFTDEDEQAVDLVKKSKAPVIAVFNKIDKLNDKPKLLALIEQYQRLHDFAAYIPISAAKGEGLEVLLEEIIKRLPRGPALFPKDYLTDQPLRFLAAEIIREQVLRHTRDEVPHAVAVIVDQWDESPKPSISSAHNATAQPETSETGRESQPRRGGLVRIAATIYVEREGQKAILIGAGGALLKKIGTSARLAIERQVEKKVFLQTFVKVRPRWREDPEFLAASDWRNTIGR